MTMKRAETVRCGECFRPLSVERPAADPGARVMTWTPRPGKPRDLVGRTADARVFLVHVGHGELWYPFEMVPGWSTRAAFESYAGRGKPYDGPDAREAAKRWCERVATRPRRRGLVSDAEE